MRDRTVGETFYFQFTTRAFATGIPTTLAGTPVISAYENEGLTQITAGLTLGVDHDSVTGLNLITVVATGGNGFEAGKDYSLVITTGTVGGVSVVGEVVGSFSLGLSAAFTRLGTPAGASIAADLVVIDNFVDGIETAVITNAAGVDIAADIIAVKAETATIVTDTNEIQGKLPTNKFMGSSDGADDDGNIAAILADTNELQTDNIPGLISALNDLAASDVLTQVNAALDTAISELGVAAPAATPTIRTGLMLLYMALRNKTVVQTSGTDALEVYNDAGTIIAKKLLTDDGSDLTEAEMTSG